MAAVGDAAGIPVSLVEFSPTGGDMGPLDVAEEINRQHKVAKSAAPAWVMLRGDEPQMDSDILAYLKAKNQVRVAAEVSGKFPLGVLRHGGSDDRHPMFDHVALVVQLPFDPRKLKVQTFNSIVLRGRVSPKILSEFDAELARREYTGRRHVEGEGEDAATLVVARHGRGWRMTRAYCPER